MTDAMMCAGQAFIREWKANFENESDKIKDGVEEFCEWIQTECFDESKLDWIIVSAGRSPAMDANGAIDPLSTQPTTTASTQHIEVRPAC